MSTKSFPQFWMRILSPHMPEQMSKICYIRHPDFKTVHSSWICGS